jgi:hypothetical protein
MDVAVARPDDSEAIARVHVRTWQAAYATLFPAEYLAQLPVADWAAAWRSNLETGDSRTLVVKQAGDVCGVVSFHHCRDEDAPPDRGEIWLL